MPDNYKRFCRLKMLLQVLVGVVLPYLRAWLLIELTPINYVEAEVTTQTFFIESGDFFLATSSAVVSHPPQRVRASSLRAKRAPPPVGYFASFKVWVVAFLFQRLSAESAPTSQDKDNNKAPEQEAKPENNRAPSQERENFAPRDFGRPMDFDRPPQDGPADRAPLDGPSARPQSDGPPNRPPFDGPPGGGPGRPPLDGPPGRPPNDVPPGRTPLDGASGRPPHDGPPGRPPFDGPPGRPPPEFGRPRGGFDNSRRGGFDRERERRFDRGRSPPERERSYDRDRDRDRDRSERSYDRDRDRDRPPRDFGRDRDYGRDRGRDRRDGPREMRGGSDRFRDFGRDQRDRGGRYVLGAWGRVVAPFSGVKPSMHLGATFLGLGRKKLMLWPIIQFILLKLGFPVHSIYVACKFEFPADLIRIIIFWSPILIKCVRVDHLMLVIQIAFF